MASLSMITSSEVLNFGSLYVLSLLVVGLTPFSPLKTLRYYGCYICYVFLISSAAIVLFPVFILRPKNCDNLRVAGALCRYVTCLLGIEWELKSPDILEADRGAVIVANHQSMLDILGMFNIWHVMGKCTAVAKKELLYMVPFGPMAWLGGLIFIDRVDPRKANQELQEASRVIHTDKVKVWVFPEGTRNKTGSDLLPFRRGAFRIAIEHQVPIIPLVYSPYYFIDSKNKIFNKGKIIISPLEPIPTKGLTVEDIDSLKDRTHAIMSEELIRLQTEVRDYQKMESLKKLS